MNFKYKGKTYFLDLNAEGKVVNRELEIEGDTTAEVQAKIRKHVDAERSQKDKIKILTFGEWHGATETEYYEGTTTGIGDRWGIWVSWREDGESRRAKMARHKFWLDTPENRAVLDKICEIRKRIQDLGEQENALSEQLTTLTEN